MKGCKNKYVKKQVKRTLKRCQDFGKVLVALETLYSTFESNLSVREDMHTFTACSILHDILWEAKVVRSCVQLGQGGPILSVWKGCVEGALGGDLV